MKSNARKIGGSNSDEFTVIVPDIEQAGVRRYYSTLDNEVFFCLMDVSDDEEEPLRGEYVHDDENDSLEAKPDNCKNCLYKLVVLQLPRLFERNGYSGWQVQVFWCPKVLPVAVKRYIYRGLQLCSHGSSCKEVDWIQCNKTHCRYAMGVDSTLLQTLRQQSGFSGDGKDFDISLSFEDRNIFESLNKKRHAVHPRDRSGDKTQQGAGRGKPEPYNKRKGREFKESKYGFGGKKARRSKILLRQLTNDMRYYNKGLCENKKKMT
ncbi:hypothetical protein ACET3Z_008243 [Daucus carota]